MLHLSNKSVRKMSALPELPSLTVIAVIVKWKCLGVTTAQLRSERDPQHHQEESMHHIRRGLFKQWDIVSVWGHAGDSRLQRYGRLFRSRHRQPVGQLPALLRVPHRRLRRAGIRRGWQETQPCQFLRLSCDTPPQIVYSLMTAHWGVPSPNLVVSVVGGGGCEKVKTWVREVLRQGLVKAAQRTGETHIHTNRHTMVCCDGGWSEHS
ncbi:uncharacterized protein ACWYII_007710 isoform 2-T2 [Salvelinus alpinus]